MLNKTAFILASVALLLTVSLIISVFSVFNTAIEPDVMYNTLIEKINKDMEPTLKFYLKNCHY